MNVWVEFTLAAVVRFVCGTVLGCIAAMVFGYKAIFKAFGQDRFPYEYFFWWGLIGGIVCVFTTPRELWPWNQD